MKIVKKICDGCRKETKKNEMYLTLEGDPDPTIWLKYFAGVKPFQFSEGLDFCSIECFKAFLEKLLINCKIN